MSFFRQKKLEKIWNLIKSDSNNESERIIFLIKYG